MGLSRRDFRGWGPISLDPGGRGPVPWPCDKLWWSFWGGRIVRNRNLIAFPWRKVYKTIIRTRLICLRISGFKLVQNLCMNEPILKRQLMWTRRCPDFKCNGVLAGAFYLCAVEAGVSLIRQSWNWLWYPVRYMVLLLHRKLCSVLTFSWSFSCRLVKYHESWDFDPQS